MEFVPWKKYALIADIVQKTKHPIGKTAIQKFVYLLQTLYKMDCGYSFRFYTYGPFCSELLGDLDTVSSCGGVTISSPSFGNPGYKITIGDACEQFRQKSPDFLLENEEQINAMLEKFGSCSAEDLELYATIVWVDRELQERGEASCLSEVVDIVQDLKPKFSAEKIRNYVSTLENQEHIRKYEDP